MSWQSDVLAGIGAPNTASNESFLSTWAAYEGSDMNAANGWNPLNTTQPEPGSFPFPGNSAGVQSYTGYSQGVQATVQTLQNGYYPNIVAAMQSGDPFTYPNAAGIQSNLDTWGTKDWNFAAGGATPSGVPPQAIGSGLQLGVDLTGSLFNQYASFIRVLDPFVLALLVCVGLLVFGVMGWSNRFASYAAVIIFLLLMIHSSAQNGATPNGTSSASIPPASQITQPNISYTNTVQNGGSSGGSGSDTSGLLGLGSFLGIF